MIFSIEETAKGVGVAAQTARNWISSGALPIPLAQRGGKGNPIGLTRFDVLVLLIAAELSHLGIGPKQFKEIVPKVAFKASEMISLLGKITEVKNIEELHILKKVNGKYQPVPAMIELRDTMYCVIYYDKAASGKLSYKICGAADTISEAADVTKIVVDLFRLGQKYINLLESIPQVVG